MYVCKSTCLSGKIYVDVYVFSLPCTLPQLIKRSKCPAWAPVLRLKFLPLMCIKELWMQGFCLKKADSGHYSYPECGLKFLVLKGVPKVLNCLERRPKLLMVCKADVPDLAFISLRPLDQWVPWNWRKCTWACVPKESLCHSHWVSEGLWLQIRWCWLCLQRQGLLLRATLASSTFRRSPDTPALPSIWAKTHRGSLTLSQEQVMESHSQSRATGNCLPVQSPNQHACSILPNPTSQSLDTPKN